MKKEFLSVLTACFLLFGMTGLANALLISDIDLNTFDFDIVDYDKGSSIYGLNGDATASGTSNGIGWEISPTSLWSVRTTTNGSFTFSTLPDSTDNLHPGQDFTITFDTTIDVLLVALSNDNLSDSINFGITPVDYYGVSVSGTQISLNRPSGGLALFENINSLTVSHINNNGINDGFDLAFHVVSTSEPVPEPSTLILFGAGLSCFAGSHFRKKRLKK